MGDFWSGAGGGVIGGLLGMIGGHQNERRHYGSERKLMDLQFKNQKALNQQGSDLQMDMWNKTNYKAQVDHMLEAGLNPALMYGSAGQGGTTGSQGGGAASKGNAQMMQMMDLQATKLGAEIGAILEGTERSKWERGDKGTAEINDLEAATALKNSNINLNETQVEKLNADIEKIGADTSLTKKIMEMDYGGQFGKNMTQNIIDILTGEAGLDMGDYLSVAAGIGGLSMLRNGKLVGKGVEKAKKAVDGVIKKLKGKLKVLKKPKVRPVNEFDYKKLQRNLDAETYRRRSMDIGN